MLANGVISTTKTMKSLLSPNTARTAKKPKAITEKIKCIVPKRINMDVMAANIQSRIASFFSYLLELKRIFRSMHSLRIRMLFCSVGNFRPCVAADPPIIARIPAATIGIVFPKDAEVSDGYTLCDHPSVGFRKKTTRIFDGSEDFFAEPLHRRRRNREHSLILTITQRAECLPAIASIFLMSVLLSARAENRMELHWAVPLEITAMKSPAIAKEDENRLSASIVLIMLFSTYTILFGIWTADFHSEISANLVHYSTVDRYLSMRIKYSNEETTFQ